jgi:BolA family transcriptional regulator, general stress-responsive regulator
MTQTADQRPARIRENLERGLSPTECRVEDESAQHIGHAGAASGGGHYRIWIVSQCFEGLTRLARHRLVYDCLAEMMHREIHALAIHASSPGEMAAQQ